jgi:hypothetical protein
MPELRVPGCPYSGCDVLLRTAIAAAENPIVLIGASVLFGLQRDPGSPTCHYRVGLFRLSNAVTISPAKRRAIQIPAGCAVRHVQCRTN